MTQKEPFESVYEKNFSSIYNFVYAQLMHKERTEDLVSEVFIKAYAHYDGYDPSKASAKTWLTNIARNTLIDMYRKNSSRSFVSLDDEETYIEPSYEDQYEIFKEASEQEVLSILSGLTPEERELLGMIYFQNMKNEEIGQVLGINAKAVSARHHRLLKKCRDMVKDKDISDYL